MHALSSRDRWAARTSAQDRPPSRSPVRTAPTRASRVRPRRLREEREREHARERHTRLCEERGKLARIHCSVPPLLPVKEFFRDVEFHEAGIREHPPALKLCRRTFEVIQPHVRSSECKACRRSGPARTYASTSIPIAANGCCCFGSRSASAACRLEAHTRRDSIARARVPT